MFPIRRRYIASAQTTNQGYLGHFIEIHLPKIIHLPSRLLPKIRFIAYLPMGGHIAMSEYGQHQDSFLTNNQLLWSRLPKLDWQPTRSMSYVLGVRYLSEKSSFYQFLMMNWWTRQMEGNVLFEILLQTLENLAFVLARWNRLEREDYIFSNFLWNAQNLDNFLTFFSEWNLWIILTTGWFDRQNPNGARYVKSWSLEDGRQRRQEIILDWWICPKYIPSTSTSTARSAR